MKDSSLAPQAVQNLTWTSIPGGFRQMTGDCHLILAGLDFRPYLIAGDKRLP